MFLANYVCKSAACYFDKSATPEIIFFEILILLGAVLSIFLFSKIKNKSILRFAILALGVFIFEFFTNTLWMNYHLGRWAYVYQDVSWIITLGWTTLIFLAMFLVEKYFNDYSELKKFILMLVFITVLGLFGESAVVNLGIRSYSPEALDVINGIYLPYINVPLVALYYIPVFMALVISFYKFWSVFIEHKIIAPFSKSEWKRKLLISFIGILLLEIMVDPMLLNNNLPSWSYIYRDVNILMTGGWIVIVWLAIFIVDKLFPYINSVLKFFGYAFVAMVITLPAEAIIVAMNIREYTQTAVENFSGYHVPFLNIPVEIVFAIYFYLAFVIAFTHYWTYYSNKVIKNK